MSQLLDWIRSMLRCLTSIFPSLVFIYLSSSSLFFPQAGSPLPASPVLAPALVELGRALLALGQDCVARARRAVQGQAAPLVRKGKQKHGRDLWLSHYILPHGAIYTPFSSRREPGIVRWPLNSDPRNHHL